MWFAHIDAVIGVVSTAGNKGSQRKIRAHWLYVRAH